MCCKRFWQVVPASVDITNSVGKVIVDNILICGGTLCGKQGVNAGEFDINNRDV
jgi:hypothetical protein